MTVRKNLHVYPGITPTAQVTAPGLLKGFSFRGLKKLKGGDSWINSTAQRKEHWTGGASDIGKAESSGEDPRATGGLVSNLPHPRVNKTKQHRKTEFGKKKPRLSSENQRLFAGSFWRGWARCRDYWVTPVAGLKSHVDEIRFGKVMRRYTCEDWKTQYCVIWCGGL